MALVSSGPQKRDGSDVIHQETSQRRPAWPHRSLVHLPRDDSTLVTVAACEYTKSWVS